MENSQCWKCDYWVKVTYHWIAKLFGIKDYCARCGAYAKAEQGNQDAKAISRKAHDLETAGSNPASAILLTD